MVLGLDAKIGGFCCWLLSGGDRMGDLRESVEFSRDGWLRWVGGLEFRSDIWDEGLVKRWISGFGFVSGGW